MVGAGTYTAGGVFRGTTVVLDGFLDVRSASDASAFAPLWCGQSANINRGRRRGRVARGCSYITGFEVGAMCKDAQKSYEEQEEDVLHGCGCEVIS